MAGNHSRIKIALNLKNFAAFCKILDVNQRENLKSKFLRQYVAILSKIIKLPMSAHPHCYKTIERKRLISIVARLIQDMKMPKKQPKSKRCEALLIISIYHSVFGQRASQF